MATDPQRKVAADARRAAKRIIGTQDREQTAALRKFMREQYDRGHEAGREEMQAELSAADARHAVLNLVADFLDIATARLTGTPNATRAVSALRESASIVRDARDLLGQDVVGPEPEGEAEEVEAAAPPPKPRKRAKATAA